MKISNEFLPYLEGSSFNDALPIKVEQAEKLQDRMDFIEAIMCGKRVVHNGCLDQVPLTQARMQSNCWLH